MAASQRLEFIDRLRGLVIILMILDHTRDYFHADAFQYDPLDLSQSTPLLFMTRWITHLCAATFVFLSGASIWLQRDSGKTGWGLTGFLLSRGLWLIALEVTVVAFGFNFALPFVFLQVIYAIGMGMVFMAALVWLPRPVVLIIGLALISLLPMLAGIDGERLPLYGSDIWRLLIEPGRLLAVPGFIAYPALPWLGIMAVGYGIAPVFKMSDGERKTVIFATAIAALCLFFVLRGGNFYGDPRTWSPQDTPVQSVMSYLSVSKYPPSLHFALVTLGLSMLLGLLIEGLKGWPGKMLLAFGRAPLFAYVLHIYFIHLLALGIGIAMGVPASAFFGFLAQYPSQSEHGWGLPLWCVYLIWIGIVAAMYPPSAFWARLKARHGRGLLSYL